MKVIVSLLFACVAYTSADVCCQDVGCFVTGGVYKHLPTPKCVEDFGGVTLALYTSNNKNSPQYLERTGSLPSQFSNSRRSIFVIHGYLNSGTTDYMIYIKDALLGQEDANVFLVDWRKGAMNPFYPSSAANTRTVGAAVAYGMDRLVDAGLSRKNLWCVGFSLGAHACGFTGMSTQVQRVTGLDPAGPWFDGYNAASRLNPSVATLVDVMHTDGGGIVPYYGLLSQVGHMDFYPNEGKNQPSCFTYLTSNGTLVKSDDMLEKVAEYAMAEMDAGVIDEDIATTGDISISCSHMRAVAFFEKSTQSGCFITRQICTDERKLPRSCSSCSQGICGEMGYHADKYSVHGKFYLETSGKSPYCRY